MTCAHDHNAFDAGSLFGDLDTDLSGAELPEVVKPAGPAPVVEGGFVEICGKCRGTGRYQGFSSRGVECFACKGKGRLVYKTDAATRAKRRQSAADAQARKAEAHGQKLRAWMEAHAAEVKWLAAAAGRGFRLAQEFSTDLGRYGDLSEGKLAAVRRFMAEDAERAARKEADKLAQQAAAPTVQGAGVERLEEAFTTAKGNGIKNPKLRLDTFVFKPAKADSANAGAIYVTEGETYLGKIAAGKFVCVSACSTDQKERIVAAASDPSAAATAYGQRTGKCSVCARELTNGESIARAIGPICAEKYGF